MADNKNSCCPGNTTATLLNPSGGNYRDTVCIDVNRVLDSCRDKDCFEDIRVYLTDFGQEVVERAGSIRVKCANIVWTYVGVDPVQFNRGFYQIMIRFYVKLTFEACICLGKIQEIEGIAVCEKKVILFGSEGNVNIFKSDPNCANFCTAQEFNRDCSSNNLPTAVCEVVDPVVLDTKIVEKQHPCCCCCCCDEIPEKVCNCLTDTLCGHDDGKKLMVCLGFFSVIRIERPGQYLISASEYSVPDKECVMLETDNPCTMFRKMAFPVNEFAPPPFHGMYSGNSGCDCEKGCNNK